LLTADLISVKVKDGAIALPPLRDKDRAILRALADELLGAARAGVGRSRAEVTELLASVVVDERLARARRALTKLIDDRARYTSADGEGAPALRAAVFAHATAARRALSSESPREEAPLPFSRDSVLDAVARARALTRDDVEARLFADLREQDTLTDVDLMGPDELVARYEVGRVQALLIRAERVRFELALADPDAVRRLVRALAFHQLLFVVERDLEHGTCAITVDGPASLLEATTRYGVRLALVVPRVLAAGARALTATVRHGHARRRLTFALASLDDERRAAQAFDREDDVERREVAAVRALLERDRSERAGAWRVEPARELFVAPGTGVVVPDLVCAHDDGTQVFVEILGHWSRDAVWRRVDMVATGALPAMLFIASAKLRVDAGALATDRAAALLVTKGDVGIRALTAALDGVRTRATSKKRRAQKPTSKKKSAKKESATKKASTKKPSTNEPSTKGPPTKKKLARAASSSGRKGSARSTTPDQ